MCNNFSLYHSHLTLYFSLPSFLTLSFCFFSFPSKAQTQHLSICPLLLPPSLSSLLLLPPLPPLPSPLPPRPKSEKVRRALFYNSLFWKPSTSGKLFSNECFSSFSFSALIVPHSRYAISCLTVRLTSLSSFTSTIRVYLSHSYKPNIAFVWLFSPSSRLFAHLVHLGLCPFTIPVLRSPLLRRLVSYSSSRKRRLAVFFKVQRLENWSSLPPLS